jgi:glycosyltransferase involved in cell wall biosynthesis
VRAVLPEATLYLAGPAPEGAFAPLPEGSHLLGYVADIRQCYGGADVFICPLRLGAGIKNKLLEAAAMESAIVASPTSIEGLDFEDGIHVLVAHNAREYAEKVRQAIDETGEAHQQMGARARLLVKDRYSWTAFGRQLESLMLSTVGLEADG